MALRSRKHSPSIEEGDPVATSKRERYELSVEQQRDFFTNGFLRVSGLLSADELSELDSYSRNLMNGKVAVDHERLAADGVEPRCGGDSPADIERNYFRFIHFHRYLEMFERYMLHLRVLDVLEELIGPDVMAMQSMLFFKPPGMAGQAYHQDSYYIKTKPDTVCGVWTAIDGCDEENGCMYLVSGSNMEPIYRDVALPENKDDFQENLTEIREVDESREVPAIAKAGDVIFFHGHLIHRSKRNRSKDRFRRAFVCHYANARSYTEWHGGNAEQILARGETHLPFHKPRFVDHDPLA